MGTQEAPSTPPHILLHYCIIHPGCSQYSPTHTPSLVYHTPRKLPVLPHTYSFTTVPYIQEAPSTPPHILLHYCAIHPVSSQYSPTHTPSLLYHTPRMLPVLPHTYSFTTVSYTQEAPSTPPHILVHYCTIHPGSSQYFPTHIPSLLYHTPRKLP